LIICHQSNRFEIKVAGYSTLMPLRFNSVSGVIIAHCHPSGNRYPGDADKLITKKLKEAGEIVEIRLLDHLILLPEGYTSLADEGLM
jgi:DNA repair protein RadC